MIGIMLLVRKGCICVMASSGSKLPASCNPSPRFVSDIHTNHAAMGTEVTRNTKGGWCPAWLQGIKINQPASSNTASHSIIQTETDEDPIRR